jgi:beta-lactamase regulating signal transducer with metallopeptidase domain/uncharacterized GH25 family protein
MKSDLVSWIGGKITQDAWMVGSWQICLIVLLGVFFSRWVAKQAELQNRAWRTIVLTFPAIALLHVFWGGWSLELSIKNDVALVSKPLTQIKRLSANTADKSNSPRPRIDSKSHQPLDGVPAAKSSENPSSEISSASYSTDSAVESPIETAVSKSQHSTEPVVGSRVNLKALFLFFYSFGLAILLLRTLLGHWSLFRISRHGGHPSEQVISLAKRSAMRLGLRRVPKITVSNELAMPLVKGFFSPTVLVPRSFLSWTKEEQTAVLLHEFAHVARGDLHWAWLARLVEAFFWFHPAAWMASRQLSHTSELATDEHVLRLGIEPSEYAGRLIDVIQRMLSFKSKRIPNGIPGLFGPPTLEARIEKILDHARATGWQRGGTMAACSGLVLFAFVTTFQVKGVPAQPSAIATVGEAKKSTDGSSAAMTDKLKVNTESTFESITIAPDSLSSTASLIDALRSAPVVPNDPKLNLRRLNLSGIITLTNGEPAKQAAVLLKRKQELTEFDETKTKLMNRYERNLIRHHDIFAKAVTNESGRYEFVNVVTDDPPSPDGSRSEWIVLAMTSEGDYFGWYSLLEEGRSSNEQNLDLQLDKTTSISLRFIDSNAKPIANAIVDLSTLRFFGQRASMMIEDFTDLRFLNSSAAVFAKSDSEGWVHFAGVPEKHAAVLAVHHPYRIARFLSIACSSDIALGYVERTTSHVMRSESDLVLANPAVLIDDEGVEVRGTVVDESGSPVAGARISRSRFYWDATTDANGKFQTRLSTDSLRLSDRLKDNLAKTQSQRSSTRSLADSPTSYSIHEIRYYVEGPEGSVYQQEIVSLDDFAKPTEIVVVLKQGVLVTGRVVSKSDGKPVAGIYVRPMNSLDANAKRVMTDTQGQFSIGLPRQEVELVPTQARVPNGFLVPSNIGYPTKGENKLIDRLKITLDLSDGRSRVLDDIQLDSLPKQKIQVLLPGGKPASNAEIDVHDSRIDRRSLSTMASQASNSRTVLTPISYPVQTDADGQAEVILSQPLSEDSVITVSYNHDGTPLNFKRPITEVSPDVLRIELGGTRKVSGRVLKNGTPVEGAEVALKENQLQTNASGAPTGMVSMQNLRNVPPAITDKEGRYSFQVDSTGDYSVSLEKLPGFPKSRVDANGRPSISFYCSKRVPRDAESIVDLSLLEGKEEIAGRVVDSTGEPVQGVVVGILSRSGSSTQSWVGYNTASQSISDEKGRFHLRKVPEGKYTLTAYKRPIPGQSVRSSRRLEVATGSQDIVIVFDEDNPPETKRLEAKKVFESRSKSSSEPK